MNTDLESLDSRSVESASGAYAWSGRQLASMSDGEATWSYKYNADGMRTEKTNGTATYKYVYSGSTLVQMSFGANGENVLFFGYDGSTPVTVTYNGTTYYYVTNLQGDIVAILDGSGTVVVEYVYNAWGDILSITGSQATPLGNYNPLRYRGYVYDRECNLYYLQSRYYDPKVGRFINADSYASTGQGILGYNMFAYCGNNPTNHTDPTGTWWWIIPIVIPFLLSGCESKSSAEPYSGQANCYAYALGLENDPSTKKPFTEKPNPGTFAGEPLEKGALCGDPVLTQMELIKKIRADMAALNYSFWKVDSADYTPAEGKWLIAIAIDPASGDYHFFKKGSDGFWSHKPGPSSISYEDSAGKEIADPQLRAHDKYEFFVGYYEIGPN